MKIVFNNILYFLFFNQLLFAQPSVLNLTDTGKIKVYIQKADYFENRPDYDSAVLYLHLATNVVSTEFPLDSSQQSAILYRISKLYARMDKIPKSIDYMNKLFDILPFSSKNDSLFISGLYNDLAYLYFTSDDYENSLFYYFKAFNIYNYDPDKYSVLLAKAYSNIGNVYYYTGNYELTLKNNFNSLTIIQKKLGLAHPYAGMNYAAIALVYTKIDEFDIAEIFYKKAYNILSNSLGENHPEVARLIRNFGLNSYYQKNYNNAIELLNKAVAICVKLYGEQNLQVADVYNELALVYSGKEDFETAIDYYQKALRIYLEYYGKNYLKIAENYNNIAEMFYKQGKLKKSLEFYKKSLEIYNKFLREPHLEYALNYTNIGIIYLEKGNYKNALVFFQKALIANSYNFNDTDIYNNPEITGIISRPDLLITLREKALALYLQYYNKGGKAIDLYSSYKTYLLTIEMLDDLRNKIQNPNKKLVLNAENKSIFINTINIAYDFYRNEPEKLNEKIYSFIEKSKSDVLYTSINDLNAKKLAGIPDSMLIDEKNFKSQLSFYSMEIQKETGGKNGYDTNRVIKLEEKYNLLENDYENFISKLEKSYPHYYELKYQTKVSTYQDIQKTLTAESAIIEYFLGDSNLYILTITKTDFKIDRLSFDTSFYKLVVDFYRSIKKVDTRDFLDFSYRLYKKLVGPSWNLIQYKKKLIIIPDEYLLYIPFETLIADTVVFHDKELDFSIPEYLIKKFNISYNYSSTLWLKNNEIHPYADTLGSSFIGFAPVFKNNTKDSLNNFNIPHELSYSEQEVNNIVKLFNDKKIPATAYLNENASEAAFKLKTKNFKFIHIATHSIINDKTPALSYILFYPVKDTFTREDGILYSAETYNLSLNADLVILSACETGIGKLVKGEGLLALSRGFLYSGANNIIFSLWNVFDKNTKELMEEFYRNVIDNQNYTSSLREAKLKMIREKSTAFPVNWGAFILVGQ